MKPSSSVIVLVVLLFIGCGKDKTPPVTVETVPLVKNETDVATGKSYSYTYDNQGRITRVDKPSTNYETYSYLPTMITWTEYSATGVMQNRVYYEINSQGFAIKATYDDPSYSTIYAYNSDKQPLKTSYYQNGVLASTIDYFYTNRQLDSSVNRSLLFGGYSVFTYEYFDNVVNTFSERNYGRLAWGEVSKKAHKAFYVKTYDAAGVFYPNTSYTISYLHELDANSRITKVTHTKIAASGTTVGTTVFNYY